MENKERQILSEIKEMMASLRSRMEALEAKMDELQQLADQEDTDMDPIDLDIEDMMVEPSVGPDDDLPFGDVPETVVEPEITEEPEMVEEPEADLMPVVEPEEEAAVIEPKVAVIDSMTDRQAWRNDMPGSHVRDIRSAISLNDRILFINTLFGQDPMAFQESLTKINQMSSLDEVVSYVVAERPDWDLESETVYRFMMAVRRKVEE